MLRGLFLGTDGGYLRPAGPLVLSGLLGVAATWTSMEARPSGWFGLTASFCSIKGTFINSPVPGCSGGSGPQAWIRDIPHCANVALLA